MTAEEILNWIFSLIGLSLDKSIVLGIIGALVLGILMWLIIKGLEFLE